MRKSSTAGGHKSGDLACDKKNTPTKINDYHVAATWLDLLSWIEVFKTRQFFYFTSFFPSASAQLKPTLRPGAAFILAA
jgi:hypothetical protein